MSSTSRSSQASQEHTGYTTANFAVPQAPEASQQWAPGEAEAYLRYIAFLASNGAQVRAEPSPLVAELQTAAQPQPKAPLPTYRLAPDQMPGGRYALPLQQAEPSNLLLRAMYASELDYRVKAQNKAFADEIRSRNAEIDRLVAQFIASGSEGVDLKRFAPNTDPYIIEMAQKQLEARRNYVRGVLRGIETPINTLPYQDDRRKQISADIARRDAQDTVDVFRHWRSNPLVRMAERAAVNWDALEDRLAAFYFATSKSNPNRGLVYHELAGYLAETVDAYHKKQLIIAGIIVGSEEDWKAIRLEETEADGRAAEAAELEEPVATDFQEEGESQPGEPLMPRIVASARGFMEGANRRTRRFINRMHDMISGDEDQPPAQTRIYPDGAAQERQAGTTARPAKSAALEQITSSLSSMLSDPNLPYRPNPRVGDILFHIRQSNPQAARALKIVGEQFAKNGILFWRAMAKYVNQVNKLSDAVIETALVQELLILADRIQGSGRPTLAFPGTAQPASHGSRAVRSGPAQRRRGTSADASGPRRVTVSDFEERLAGWLHSSDDRDWIL